jgi:mechanosensitive ion channel-like protein
MPDILTQLTQALTAFLPGLVAAIVLLIVAWIIGTIMRFVIVRVGRAARLDQRLNSQGVSATIGDIVFWLVFLLFLPGVLQALGLVGILLPVQTLLNQLLGFLPNLFAAVLIGVVGWFVARLVRRIVTGLAAAAGADRLAARVGLTLGPQGLSGLLGLIVYVLILIPVLTAALNALNLDAVTQPITTMLIAILDAVPHIFAAAVLVVIAIIVGRLVARLVTSLLAGIGFDTLPARLGLRAPALPGGRSLSALMGGLVLLAIVFFASIEALRLLGFAALAALLSQFVVLVGQILLGLVIFAIGLYLANLAATTIATSGVRQAGLLALAARVAILVLAGAMALRQMGLANEIINLAFGLLLGAIAVAVALAFGLGGRESAARVVEAWRQDLESGEPMVPARQVEAAAPADRAATVPLERTRQLEQAIVALRRPVAQMVAVQEQLRSSGELSTRQQELVTQLGTLVRLIAQAIHAPTTPPGS